jgi:hypothetical protein
MASLPFNSILSFFFFTSKSENTIIPYDILKEGQVPCPLSKMSSGGPPLLSNSADDIKEPYSPLVNKGGVWRRIGLVTVRPG